MKVIIVEESVTVADSPPGLLLLDNGTIIVKTEYTDTTPLHRCECYLTSSGERYWGDGDNAMARILVLLP